MWNAHDYIEMCIQSLIHQTYQNLELILVDDGSTDDSLDICKRYALKDKRVKVYHKPNGGQGSARNYGLNKCTGDYIGFVDDDDWILPTMYEKLHDIIIESNADVSRCSDMTKITEINPNEQGITNIIEKEEIHHLLYCDILGGHVTDRLFKRDTIGSTRFPQSKTIEDMRFMRALLDKVSREVYTSSKMYFYTLRDDNTSFVYSKNYINSFERAEEYQSRYYEAKKKFPKYSEELLIKSTTFSCGTMRILSKEHCKETSEYKKMRNFLRDNKASILAIQGLGFKYKAFVAFL